MIIDSLARITTLNLLYDDVFLIFEVGNPISKGYERFGKGIQHAQVAVPYQQYE
jgi:hypothetical protein